MPVSEAKTVIAQVRTPVSGAVPARAPVSETGATVLPSPAKKRLHRPYLGRPRLRSARIPVRVRTLDSMRYRDYRLLWAATLCISGGLWAYQVVIGWLTYDLTQSRFLTAVAQGLDSLPVLVVGFLAGMIVDTWDRRKLVASVSIYQAAVTAAFAALVILGRVEPWQIMVFVLAMGISWPITDPARISMIPNIVPRGTLVNAIALNSLAFNATRLVVPVGAGLLIAAMGPGRTLLLPVVMFLGTTLAALAIKLGKPEHHQEMRSRPSPAQMVEAVRYLKSDLPLMSLLLLGTIPVIFTIPFVIGLMPVYASEVFGVGSSGLGLLVSALGAGAILGALIVASKERIEHKGRALLLALGLIAITMTAFSMNRSIVVAIPILVLFGASLVGFWTLLSTSIQMTVPDNLRGRVTVISIMCFGLYPLGSMLAGGVATFLGAPAATLIGVFALIAVLGVFSLRFGSIWSLKSPE